jgi:SnoaL-like domain
MSATDLSPLRDQLQQLSDRQAIADLITRLGLMLDEKRYDLAPAILAEDVTVHTPGGFSRGHQPVVEQARRNHTVRTQHVFADELINVAGDRAEARANLILTFVPDSDEPESRLVIGNAEQPYSRLVIGERYRFEAVRGERGWRLSTIEASRLWSSEPLPTGAPVRQTNLAATAASR